MKVIRHIIWRWVLPGLVAGILYPYIKTVRVQLLTSTGEKFKRDPKDPSIYAHFHEDIPLMSLSFAFSKVCTMASKSKDGELIARSLSFLGFKMVRGSSKKYFGQQTLEEIIKAFDDGYDFALAVDGPRGPRHEVKEGISYIASKAKRRVIPAVAYAKHKIVFKKSWDQMWVPLPFSKAVIVCGDPIEWEKADKERIQQELIQLKNRSIW